MVNSLVDLLANSVAVCILFVYNYSLKIIFDERLKGILLQYYFMKIPTTIYAAYHDSGYKGW